MRMVEREKRRREQRYESSPKRERAARAVNGGGSLSVGKEREEGESFVDVDDDGAFREESEGRLERGDEVRENESWKVLSLPEEEVEEEEGEREGVSVVRIGDSNGVRRE